MRENSFVSVCVSFQTLEGSLSTRLLYAKEKNENVGRFLDRKSVFLLVTQVVESFAFPPPPQWRMNERKMDKKKTDTFHAEQLHSFMNHADPWNGRRSGEISLERDCVPAHSDI